ncbi:MAG: hypothetical protein KGL93_02465 [Gemmatimonadota bacterium]|nr:hypothetical protein [Gemmatimonadota bacterium]HEU4988673.1 hypothetical protein [Gemmatimonadaceae bacterium]
MRKTFGIGLGAAAAVAAMTLAASAAATGAGAQKASVHPDTVSASADTNYQSEGMQEFERRRKLGGGWYLTRRDLHRDRDHSLGDIITMHFPGLRTVYGEHLGMQFLVSTRGEGPNALVSNTGPSLCYVQVFVDGAFIIDSDISWINPDNVAGVEYYDVTRTPPAYRRSNGECGVLLVWSRTGD